MRPDRLSLFNSAHMPQIFKVQRQIDVRLLPEPQEKLQILHNSIGQLQAAGYVSIGMDHFALPNGALAIAQRNQVLHRNFQGYAAHGNCNLFAFGVSAISAINNTFSQNYKDVQQYQDALEAGHLLMHKGLRLSRDDELRRAVINQLICHFEPNFQTMDQRLGICFSEYFANELSEVEQLAEDGLLQLGPEGIHINDSGRLLIRRVCMIFDAYVTTQKDSGRDPMRYPRII